MPFQSEAQRRYLWAHDPKTAKKWADEPSARNRGLPAHKRKAKGRKTRR
jgi:hypothetical protein